MCYYLKERLQNNGRHVIRELITKHKTTYGEFEKIQGPLLKVDTA